MNAHTTNTRKQVYLLDALVGVVTDSSVTASAAILPVHASLFGGFAFKEGELTEVALVGIDTDDSKSCE